MQIVVNHLTRMQKGFICVAGVELETRAHVRPVMRQRLRTALLARHGGPFDIGCVLDLGRVVCEGKPPACEDRRFLYERLKRLGRMRPAEFWNLLSAIAQPQLNALFGSDLRKRGMSACGVDAGKGCASLGCLIPALRPRLCIERKEGRDRIRLHVSDGEFHLNLGVTDVRLYGADHVTPDPAAVDAAAKRLRTTNAILSVGLGWPPPDSDVHWLQANNIHFEDEPCWQLG